MKQRLLTAEQWLTWQKVLLLDKRKKMPVYLIGHPNFNTTWFFDDVTMLHSSPSCCMAPVPAAGTTSLCSAPQVVMEANAAAQPAWRQLLFSTAKVQA